MQREAERRVHEAAKSLGLPPYAMPTGLVVDRAEDGGDAGGVCRRWRTGVSNEGIGSTGTETGIDADENPVKRLVMGTGVAEDVRAHAGYTCATEWLEQEDRTVKTLAKQRLEPVWGEYPRANMAASELMKTSQFRPGLRRWRVIAVGEEKRRQELMSRWLGKGRLYRVPSEYRCEWTFVMTVEDMKYIQQTNVELREG